MRAVAENHAQQSLRLAEVAASFSLAADRGTRKPMEWAVRLGSRPVPTGRP